MPATLEKPTPVQFRALASAGKIDPKNGIIHGVSVITIGPALGHGVSIDEKGLKQCLDACEAMGEEGVKLVLDHDSGFQEIVGAIKNFRISGIQLLGDAYLLENAPARDQVLELAQKLPRNIGLSVETYGDPEKVGEKKFWRVDSIDAIALVPNPAANKSGLFSKRGKKTSLSEIALEELREKVRIIAANDPRFADPNSNGCPGGYAWVSDIVNDEGDWSAIIQGGGDSKFYQVDLTLDENGQVELGDATEVIRAVSYAPVDTSTQSNLETMDANEIKTLFSEALKPINEAIAELKGKVEAGDSTKLSAKLDEHKTALAALPTTEKLGEVVKAEVEKAVKEQAPQIAADAVTKFAATVGLKKAPDGQLENQNGGKTSFAAKIDTHLTAGAKDRATAILRAKNDDPAGYTEWEKAGRPEK